MKRWAKHYCYYTYTGRQIIALFLALTVVVSAGSGILSSAVASNSSGPAWSAPTAMAIKRVSDTEASQNEPNFLNNTDCQSLTYRTTGSNTMQSGCFTATAFGEMDSDDDLVIFNGTDEALPLNGFTSSQVLVPWNNALELVSLASNPTGGSFISLYRDPLAVLQDQRGLLGQLTAKNLTSGPDLRLRDKQGQPLIINPQTIAFSSSGSWMVVETLVDSFVRINLATLDITAFAPAIYSSGTAGSQKSQVAISSDGHYVALKNDVTDSFSVIDLTKCTGTTDDVAHSANCASAHYMPFIHNNISGLLSIRHIRFVNDGLLSFEARTDKTATSGIYELAPTATIDSLINYLGLGDSYTSGEGAYDYVDGTDTANDKCHLSSRSYPLLLSHDLFGNAGGRSVACSGAVIDDIGSQSDSYQGQNSNNYSWATLQQNQPALRDSVMTNYLPGYVAQQRFVAQYQPAVISVSVSGDDIGFGDILQRCVEPQISQHFSDSICFDTYEDRQELKQLIDKTSTRLASLYKQLLRESPSSRLYAIGYPQIAVDDGSCAFNVHLSRSELEFSQELIDYLNNSVHQAAEAAHVNYVDISQALKGHRLCETASYNVAVNGLTAGKDAGVLGINFIGSESYHPSALGQSLIEQAILAHTHNFSLAVDEPSTPVSSGSLDNAPKTGRSINQLAPTKNVTDSTTKVGATITVKLDAAGQGLPANTSYTVRLDGAQGNVIGSVNSGQPGQATIPANTPVGIHTIDITGPDQTGQPIDIRQPVTVAPITDPANQPVSCPIVGNSGQDIDQDGIDDACDDYIGPAPTTPATLTPASPQPAQSPINSVVSAPVTASTISTPAVGVALTTPQTNPVRVASLTGQITALTSASAILATSASTVAGSNVLGMAASVVATGLTGNTTGTPLPLAAALPLPKLAAYRLPTHKPFRAHLWSIGWLQILISVGLILVLCWLIKRWIEHRQPTKIRVQ